MLTPHQKSASFKDVATEMLKIRLSKLQRDAVVTLAEALDVDAVKRLLPTHATRAAYYKAIRNLRAMTAES